MVILTILSLIDPNEHYLIFLFITFNFHYYVQRLQTVRKIKRTKNYTTFESERALIFCILKTRNFAKLCQHKLILGCCSSRCRRADNISLHKMSWSNCNETNPFDLSAIVNTAILFPIMIRRLKRITSPAKTASIYTRQSGRKGQERALEELQKAKTSEEEEETKLLIVVLRYKNNNN